jgi:lysophospholipase L1-like esterase
VNAHATGITLALTVALAAGLSLAPIPDVFRPFPDLATDSPAAVIARMLLPSRVGGEVHAQDALTGAPEVPAAVEAEAEEKEEPAPLDEAQDRVDALAAASPPGNTRFYAGLPSFEVRRARALDGWAERIGARHVEIEEGCRSSAAEGTCVRRALDDFFDRLEPLRRGDGVLPVRIVHLGDSQIASDYITDLVRRRLELRYGSSGQGFLFVDRPTRFSGRKVRTGEASEGWEIVKITERGRPGVVGFSGVRFTANDAGQSTRYEVGRARSAEVAFVTSPDGGNLEISGDGKPLSRVLTRFDDTELAFWSVQIPPGTKTLTLRADGGEVSLLGVTLESGAPGVVYDTVGLPGAMFDVFLRGPERAFAAQLAHRDPALVVVMLGGNEAYKMGRGWLKLDKARAHAKALVQRIRSTAPGASCLLLAPMDAGVRDASGSIVPRAHTHEVGAAIREVALESGCGFWDALAAMGGEGAAARWYQQKLFQDDLIHPKRRGADILGHLFEVALERARQSRPGMLIGRLETTELEGAAGAPFARLFANFRGQKRGTTSEPTAILQVAEAPFSSEAFTSRVRSRLASAFPTPGRALRLESLAPPESTALSEGEWAEAGRAREANLVVIAPAAAEDTAETDAEAFRARQASVLSSLRSAAQDAACLLVGPPDRLRPLPGGGVVPDESVDLTTRVLRELAESQGCAFWSARAAMGGRGAMKRWQSLDPALGDASGTRLTAAGVSAVADAFAEELLAAWRSWVVSGDARAEAGNGPSGGAR